MTSTETASRPGPTHTAQRVRHDLKLRRLTVQSVETMGPHMVSVRLAGAGLNDFPSIGFDDHIKLMLPAEPGAPLLLPTIGPDGLRLLAGGAKPVMRDYTPRRFDRQAGTLDLEFVLHGHGVAGTWAAQAAIGQEVGVGGPRSSFVVAADLDWHWLMGDESALPAIARRLEELPATAQAWVVVQTSHPATRRALQSAAQVHLQWLDEGQSLADAVAQLKLPPGEGHAWAACEAATVAKVRSVLVGQHGLHKAQVRAAAYWKQGAPGHHETL